MEFIKTLIYIIFFFLLLYTLVFIFQWLCGLFVSVKRYEQYDTVCRSLEELYLDDYAKKYPVSVIVPAYNEAVCINDTITSLLSEDYPNLQIIVVDDGSKDHTVNQLVSTFSLEKQDQKYQANISTQPVKAIYKGKKADKTIVLLEKANGGKADALNCGLNICNSKYCVIVDADTQVEKGSLKRMAAKFLLDDKVIVCAGNVGSKFYGSVGYKKLKWVQKLLVIFQKLEYYRTFYLQRVLFDCMNANIIVSGAFAMFDCELLKSIGGYRVNTIGEDMEMTMRLHAFCHSQHRKYRIAFIPEARCFTQIPFTYHDYYQQRRRWHIGMIQSMKQHFYMLGNHHYGMVGIMSGTFIMLYELIAPLVELIGLITLGLAWLVGILNIAFTLKITMIGVILITLTQFVLIIGLHLYDIEDIDYKLILKLIGISFVEFFFFHPYNIIVKFNAFFTQKRNRHTWKHITREME